MAWIDDRVWCHPKLTEVSDKAAWTWVKSVAYASGFQTRGNLSPGQQKTIGSNSRVRRELITAGLWDEADQGSICVHDWESHNARRDAKRAYDRERKRLERDADPDSWVVRSGKWQHTRREVFERDHGVCVDCGEYNDHWHADHVPRRAVLRARGLDLFDPAYIQTRCPRCHSRRHILERTGQRTDNGQSDGPARADGVKNDKKDKNPKAVAEASYERPRGCTIASISDAAMRRAVEIAAAAGATA